MDMWPFDKRPCKSALQTTILNRVVAPKKTRQIAIWKDSSHFGQPKGKNLLLIPLGNIFCPSFGGTRLEAEFFFFHFRDLPLAKEVGPSSVIFNADFFPCSFLCAVETSVGTTNKLSWYLR